jgi:hypothetical protein
LIEFSIRPFFISKNNGGLAMSEAVNKYHDPESIYNIEGLSVRALSALDREDIKTKSALLLMTDYELLRIRNFGQKCLDEINQAFPERETTYAGEYELLGARRMWHKLDTTARRILRFMEQDKMKLADFLVSDSKVEGRAKARVILTEYCLTFPDRVDDVLKQFEAMQDTADRFYIMLKQASIRKQAISQGLIEN